MRWLLLMFAVVLVGCGTTSSSVPIYPAGWPAIVKAGEAGPDISGTYQAESEPAGPLVYPNGGRPRELFFFVPIGRPETPVLGRRFLPWHLAMGVSSEQRDAISMLDAVTHTTTGEAWVKLARGEGGVFEVACGVDQATSVSFTLAPARQRSFLASILAKPDGYTVEDGSLVTNCLILTAMSERAAVDISSANAAGGFSFWLAEDGSLIMLESLYWENAWPKPGSLVFQKWWRWRRMDVR